MAGMQHVFEVARQVQALLDGSASSPQQQGLTTAEERSACSIPQVQLARPIMCMMLGVHVM